MRLCGHSFANKKGRRLTPLFCSAYLFAATVASAAADARKDENEPNKVATVASAHVVAATASVEQKQKQDEVARICASASVCTTVCKESVHFMYLLYFWISPTLPYATVKNYVPVHFARIIKIYFFCGIPQTNDRSGRRDFLCAVRSRALFVFLQIGC